MGSSRYSYIKVLGKVYIYIFW